MSLLMYKSKYNLNLKSKFSKATPKKTYAKKTVKASTKKLINLAVKKAIKKDIEVKSQAENTTSDTPIVEFGEAPPSTALSYAITPLNTIFNLVTQGVGQGGRIGNKITLDKFHVAYCLKSSIDDWLDVPVAATERGFPIQPSYVDVYILRRKDGTIEADEELSSFFQFGSTVLAPTTNINDTMFYINKDIYNVLYHKRELLVPVGDLGTTGDSNMDSSGDSMASVVRRINLTKHIKKVLSYNDNTSQVQDEPTTNMFMVCLPSGRCGPGPMWVQGSGEVATSYPIGIQLSVSCFLDYIDA